MDTLSLTVLPTPVCAAVKLYTTTTTTILGVRATDDNDTLELQCLHKNNGNRIAVNPMM